MYVKSKIKEWNRPFRIWQMFQHSTERVSLKEYFEPFLIVVTLHSVIGWKVIKAFVLQSKDTHIHVNPQI